MIQSKLEFADLSNSNSKSQVFSHYSVLYALSDSTIITESWLSIYCYIITFKKYHKQDNKSYKIQHIIAELCEVKTFLKFFILFYLNKRISSKYINILNEHPLIPPNGACNFLSAVHIGGLFSYIHYIIWQLEWKTHAKFLFKDL